ncbi:MAG: membrane dipeptidase [Pseudomonadota bacterium]
MSKDGSISKNAFRIASPVGPLPQGLSGWLARIADRASNKADRRDLPFHPELQAAWADAPPTLLADLHSDTLLWGVDPWRARSGGHMDLPRLFEARVGLQVFGGPTWTPLPMSNSEQALCVSCESIDQTNALFPSDWIDRVRRSKAVLRRRRAHRLAERFHMMRQADLEGRLRAIFNAADLDGLRVANAAGDPGPAAPLGVMLSLEGLHWIEPDDPDALVEAEVRDLRAAGYRMIAPTHRFSNGLSGASEDCEGRMGLSRAGRTMIRACFDECVAVDLAHASPAAIREAAGLALTHPSGARPLVVSHAGIRGAHPVPRNLRAADVRAVASTGGVIGVGMWREAVGFAEDDPFETKIKRIVDAFAAARDALTDPDFAEEMIDRYGSYDPADHLALGSDFDGATNTPFDVSGLSWLLAALARRQTAAGAPMFPPAALRKIAGENIRRALRGALADPSAAAQGEGLSPGQTQIAAE